MNAILSWFGARLAEPSSWAGLAAIVSTAGPVLFPTQWATVVTVASTIGGFLALVVPEKGAAAAAPPAK
jgi:hypothetical protein